MKSNKTSKILLSLLKELGNFYEGGMNSYRGYHHLPKQEREFFKDRKEYMRLKALERAKKIKLRKVGDEIMYQFTQDGVIKALKNRIISCEALLPEGEVCIVVFDIPEDIATVRKMLRRLLKKAGFYMIQRSVWEIDKEVVDDLRFLFRLLKVEKYVRVYRALEVR